MLTSLSIKKFKAFEDETFELGRLNLLTGLNSSGKSSVIQALRLIDERKTLAGLGPLMEYVRNYSVEFNIECTRRHENGDEKLQFCYNRKTGIIDSGCCGKLSDVVSYISADRFGPRRVLPLNIDENTQTVGCHGEHIVDFLSNFEGLHVPNRFGVLISLSLMDEKRYYITCGDKKTSPTLKTTA